MVRSWSKPGAWAEEAERAEAEAAAAAAAAAVVPPAAVALAGIPAASFPSLGEAVAQKPKKKKGQTFSISELAIGKYVGPGGKMRTGMSDVRGLTPEEMMMLPTGPRERSEEEQHYGGIGGGFKDYGGGYRDRGNFRGDREQEGGGFGGARDRDSAPRPYESRGYGDRAGYDDERRREHGSDRDLPSRADEVDNWGSGKKLTVGYEDDRRRERISDRDLPSRADEVDNWGSGKKFVPSERPDQRSRMSMRDDRREGGYDSHVSKADTEDWGASKKLMPAAERRQMPALNADRWPRREMHVEESRPSERPRLKLQPRTHSLPDSESSASHGEAELPSPSISQQGDSGFSQQEVDTAPSKSTKPSPFGAARPREEVLAEKGQDWRKLDGEQESKTIQSGPSSTHSSRPGTPDVSKPRPKVDPFGNAKPREVLLQERGQDWRKIDFELEHKSVNRVETEGEIKLKEEIKSLEEQLKINADETKMNGFAGEHQDSVSLKEQLAQKEKELVRLTRELDDKVRYSQRTSEHGDTWSERPPSRRGSRDLSQRMERPRSALSDSGSQYEPSSGWPGERPLSRSGSRELDDRARVYQERPSSRDSYGSRRDGGRAPPDVWIADRPPSRTGSRRNGRPPSRGSRDEPVSQFEPAMRDSRNADIWRRPVDNDNRSRGSQYEQRNRLDRW